MIYTYSACNRLVDPHHYMYTPFEGRSMLDAFLEARACSLRHFESTAESDLEDGVSVVASTAFIDRHLARYFPKKHADWKLLLGVWLGAEEIPRDVAQLSDDDGDLAEFSVDSDVVTSALLSALVYSILAGPEDDETRVWLDRLVQRFEVTKRLYEKYPAGFRKGTGNFESLWRYWMLALALCLSLARVESLRLLNTLLKICDLLCSVEADALRKQVPLSGMRIVLAMEGANVRTLMEQKRLSVAPV